MKRRIAIVFAAGMAVFGMLLPAFVAEEVRQAPSRTYTENPPTYAERPTIVFPLGTPLVPSEGLSEPRKDRP
jgi:hypothetical protein